MKFFVKLWTVLNSAIFDFIGGFALILLGIFLIYFYSELTVSCFVAAFCGGLFAIGIDCIGHSIEPRDSSGSPDDYIKTESE